MKKFITALFSLSVFLFAFSNAYAYPSGGISKWAFDEPEGIIVEDSIDGNDGTMVDSQRSTTVKAPIYGNVSSMFFDNYNDYVVVPHADNLSNFGTSITLSAWIYANSFPSTGRVNVISKVNAYALQVGDGGQVRVWMGPLSSYVQTTGTPLETHKWYLIMATYDGSQIKVYVDGELRGSFAKSGTQATSTYPVVIGRREPMPASENQGPFDGYIDDVGIFNVVLNPSDLIDEDVDGVFGDADYCPATSYDEPSDGLGTNRWVYTASGWETKLPKGNGPKDTYTIASTYGCSCDQILSRLEEVTDVDFAGHHKFGCSKSILEDWISGEYPVDSVTIPASGEIVYSNIDAISGETYKVVASGTYTFGTGWGFDADGVPYGIADAEFSNRPSWSYGPGWILGEDVFPPTYPDYSLDLIVHGINPTWGSYNSSHVYETTTAGLGVPIWFNIWDNNYGDNSGFLTADIFVKLW